MTLLAIFDNSAAAHGAIDRLAHDTVGSNLKYEVYSTEPLHPPMVPNHLLRGAVLGGLLGGAAGGGLAVFTFMAMHLQTGHMAIVTLPATGIATFAWAALAAIAGVIFVLVPQAKLLSTKLDLPDDVRDAITRGAVAVVVESPTPEIERMLQTAGGTIKQG